MSAVAERAQERGTSDMWRVLLAAPGWRERPVRASQRSKTSRPTNMQVGATVKHAVAKRTQERGTSDMWRVLLAAPDEVGAE